MNNGAIDISNLFSRVAALEQDDMSVEAEQATISKGYVTVGIKVRFTTRLHQYPICGDTNPLLGPILGQTFI